MPDERLLALIDAAENERPCPNVLNVLTGSWLIQGQPVSSRQFEEATQQSLHESIAATPDARRFRGSHDELRQAISGITQPMLDSVAPGGGGPGEPALNLIKVMIASATGPSLHPPAIRISAASIAAWWIVDFKVKNKGGGSAGFGISF
ncbi:hypothetical protein ACVGVM_02505 [Pseudonocardia bannensis]|uniref:Uncharacterized protein n=1 Tax=Pseudonocardia bannensis TaxID=630973 RepID=A0A848DH37_9PSEU|nr:hypothetical protein [Pseudonocardia bannensis]NMH91967.1 hypothetical protein [Pseudonocardia bannensis]